MLLDHWARVARRWHSSGCSRDWILKTLALRVDGPRENIDRWLRWLGI